MATNREHEYEVTLESGEWYVLCSWLRARENQLMYALRPRSERMNRIRAIRTEIERQRGGNPAAQTVTLGAADWRTVCRYLRQRALVLLLKPWRDRERRDVRHLRDHLLTILDEAPPAEAPSETVE